MRWVHKAPCLKWRFWPVKTEEDCLNQLKVLSKFVRKQKSVSGKYSHPSTEIYLVSPGGGGKYNLFVIRAETRRALFFDTLSLKFSKEILRLFLRNNRSPLFFRWVMLIEYRMCSFYRSWPKMFTANAFISSEMTIFLFFGLLRKCQTSFFRLSLFFDCSYWTVLI